jgi:outer membrane immunogenic protein
MAGKQALAAHLGPPPPLPQAPLVPSVPFVPFYNWTGLYIGGNLGGGRQNGSFSDSTGNTITPSNQTKFLGGGQVGGNYEFPTGVVIGAEVMVDWLPNTSNTASGVTLNNTGIVPAPTASITLNNQWLTTATGKFGYAWDRALFYAKGGGAWVVSSSPTININSTPVTLSSSNSNWGWTAGAGFEYAFWGNWQARVEYDYIGLNRQTFYVPATSLILPNDQFTGNDGRIQMVTASINYRFGFGW